MPNDRTPEALIASLDNVGVDFSIPKSTIADYLGNAEFTPYPAISAALLEILNGRMLRRPVYLDVIVFNYEHSPGISSPRRPEDVNSTVLMAAIIEGFNNRYAEENIDFGSILRPQDQPKQPLQKFALIIEGARRVQDGVTLVDTDNPQVEVQTRLINVHAQWANGMVPQELVRQGRGWRFTNGDAHLSVANGEAEAGPRPVRAGSLSEGAYAWPATDGTFSGDAGSEVRLVSRIRVGYRPVDVKLVVEAPKGAAANLVEQVRIALDPQVLLVPVEVARFYSDRFPVPNISAASQMALWDQVPIIGPTTNFKSIDSSTGELRFAERLWHYWPSLDNEGLYKHLYWVSPDSIWGKAGVRFRLVNYIDIKTDDAHVAPKPGEDVQDSQLYDNDSALSAHAQHISDKPVMKAIFMHRIHGDDGHPGQALTGRNCICISAGAPNQPDVSIAHEIGHLIINSSSHSDLPNNVMQELGGSQITDAQIELARKWAQKFAGFWQR
ncbi:hypothetical protein [Micromonospora chersina]|uniref:hypothetical protein n=1 Tax=Micromonospora chersina TaxID=47854 RepID=UPI00371C208D